MLHHRFITAFFVVYCAIGFAQPQDSLLSTVGDSVFVRASRLPTLQDRVPYAISQMSQSELRDGRQQWSMADPLRRLPGLLVLNDNNFAQDLRLSVRGFGARAAFGIRGLRITVDGFPESTPDGQGQVDNIDAGILRSAELLRGPASSLYGNASGGVLRLETEAPPDSFKLQTRISAGSYGFQRYQLTVGGAAGAYDWLAYGSHSQADGFRAQSRNVASLFNGKLRRSLPNGGELSLLLNAVYSPVAEDPGGLDKQTAAESPAVAWVRNVSFDARESVAQGRVGLKWKQPIGEGQWLQAAAFYLRRDFENRLPFENGGAVQLERDFYGGSLQYNGRHRLLGRPYRIAVGASIEQQEDLRRRYDNLSGELGSLTFDQLEQFTAAGAYVVQEWSPANRFWVNASLRYDFNELKAADYFLADGENSGERAYQTLSPALGISYAWQPRHFLYANYSYSFETPALSELSAGTGGTGGFNEALQPQRAYNFEWGGKGKLATGFKYNVSLFYIRLRGELLPFEEAGESGRVRFRNAGRSRRLGLEADGVWAFAERWHLFARYNYAYFTYLDYERQGMDYAGNRLPGIPAHNGLAELSYRYRPGGEVELQGRYLSQMWANDANTITTDAFWVVDLRAVQRWNWKNKAIRLYGGLNNILGRRYSQNVRVNAFGGRYFEPAPGRNVYFGVSLALQ